MEQVAGKLIVGRREVDPAIPVEVLERDTQGVAVCLGQAGGGGDVPEAAAAFIMEQTSPLRIVSGGTAGGAHAGLVAEADPAWVEADVARDVEIEPAVAVHIREAGARAPTRVMDPGGSGDVPEVSPLVVV